MSNVSVVNASEVQEGDVLPGLDNGYVFDVESDPDVSFGSGRQYVAMGHGMVQVTYHDSQGEENYLLVGADSKVQVQR